LRTLYTDVLMPLLTDESEVENCSHTASDHSASPGAVTVISSAAEQLQTASATLSSSSSASHRPCCSQSHSSLVQADAVYAVEDVAMQSPCRSSSPATSLSDVGDESRPLSPDSSADYFKAENVSDMSESYLPCGSSVKLFTDIHFDTAPANISLDGDNGKLHSKDRSSTGRQESATLVEANKNTDEAAGQYSSQNPSVNSSHLPHSRTTFAAVTASGDSSDGKDMADFSNGSSQLNAAELSGTKSIAGRCSESGKSELPGSGDYSTTSQTALDLDSSDPEYAFVSLTQSGFTAELYGNPAPLPPSV